MLCKCQVMIRKYQKLTNLTADNHVATKNGEEVKQLLARFILCAPCSWKDNKATGFYFSDNISSISIHIPKFHDTCLGFRPIRYRLHFRFFENRILSKGVAQVLKYQVCQA